MMETGKKLNFYRLGLKEGKTRRMELTESYRLTGQGSGAFLYLAPVYDSMDLKGTWHRLVLEGTFRNCKYEIFAAAADTDLSAAVEQLWEEGRSPAASPLPDGNVSVNTRRETCVKGAGSLLGPPQSRCTEE